MRAFKIVAAALLFAALAVTTTGVPGLGDTREHILGADADISAKREHIL
jgi:hypothetical protein